MEVKTNALRPLETTD